jgi:hypothetical protein
MYAEIPDKLVDQFMNIIEEGKIYDIRKFFVLPKKYCGIQDQFNTS